MQRATLTFEAVRQRAALSLTQGISPSRLALTLALGFAIGCIPFIGIPTALCAIVALVFRLNQPAIQAANYAAMPFQVALVIPFVRLGGKLIAANAGTSGDLISIFRSPMRSLAHAPMQVLSRMGVMAGQAFLAWLLIAVPVVLLLTAMLTIVLRRVPALAAAQAGD
jgi:uncharacterized protein (DUF2062 family)